MVQVYFSEEQNPIYYKYTTLHPNRVISISCIVVIALHYRFYTPLLIERELHHKTHSK